MNSKALKSLLLTQPDFSRGSVCYSRVSAKRELIAFLLHGIFIRVRLLRVCLQHIQGLQQFVHEYSSYPFNELIHFAGGYLACVAGAKKGTGKEEFGRARARGAHEGERKGTPARTPLFSPFFTLGF